MIGRNDAMAATMKNQETRDRAFIGDRLFLAKIMTEHDPALIIGQDRIGLRNLFTQKLNGTIDLLKLLIGPRNHGTLISSKQRAERHQQKTEGYAAKSV